MCTVRSSCFGCCGMFNVSLHMPRLLRVLWDIVRCVLSIYVVFSKITIIQIICSYLGLGPVFVSSRNSSESGAVMFWSHRHGSEGCWCVYVRVCVSTNLCVRCGGPGLCCVVHHDCCGSLV